MMRFYWKCLRESKLREFDVVHCHDLDTLPMGLLISKLRNVPLVYDAHESYVDMIQWRIPEFVGRRVRKLEHFITKRCQKVIVANSAVGWLVTETTELAQACDIVMNCPESNSNSIIERTGTHLRIGYFGSLEPDRFILEAIEVVKELPNCGMVIGGSGSLEKEIVKQATECERIVFLGKLSRDMSYKLQSLCDIQLVMFKDNNANNVIGTPNRLFEAMSQGKFVIACWFTEAGNMVEKLGCGYACAYSVFPFKALLESLSEHREVLEQKGQNGLKAHLEKYNWESQEKVLLNVYQSISNGQASSLKAKAVVSDSAIPRKV